METKIERIAWPNAEAKAALGSTLSESVERDLKTGHAQCYKLAGKAVGYMVTRIETYELVICAAAGAGLVEGFKAVEAGALGKFKSIRCHCNDWRIERLYARVGLDFVETVYRKRLV